MHKCLKLGDNSNLVPAGSTATGVNMKDASNNEKISKEEHSVISCQAEEKMDTAQEDDGVGDICKKEKDMQISDEDFREFATFLQMDMSKLKEWFVESKYEAEEFRGFFTKKVRVKRWGEADECHPLHVAAFRGAVDMVDMLITETKVDVNIQTKDREGDSFNDRPEDENSQKKGRKGDSFIDRWTALHFAAVGNEEIGSDPQVRKPHAKVVQKLLKSTLIQLTIEDNRGRTAIDLASECKSWDVFDVLRLKITDEVTNYNDPYYRDRQASVDASNAILVGAALIASVTYAAWLQPPLGYSTDYNEQFSNSLPAPPISNPQYATFDHHPALHWFWVFNSLSFFLAIATVMLGARSVIPSFRVSVKQEVAELRNNLLITSTLLALSMCYVMLAFSIAGIVVVPPAFKFRAYMYFTILIGGIVSVVFLCRLWQRILFTVYEPLERRDPMGVATWVYHVWTRS